MPSFLRGKEYMRINIRTSKAGEGYPKPIEGNWPGLWPDGVDAALNVGKNKVYFFKGDEYVQYNMKSNKVVSGPKKIKAGWSGVWPTGVDAALNWDGKYIYFFKGEEYLRYNFSSDKVGKGYPKKISEGWKGLPGSNLDAAFKRN
ncbi:MAG: hemopexin repeat-containing protein [Planctomycetota bacterium]|nr:hemopexin repeat-containing protein [Planctomycetota bacterium]